ncbi:hypothetical protein JRO89_XS03G0137100 [Xanthoceras sorbifolium]|uniref:Uncharacterized protein n=1 Tax=Xanthoceras sorbifolium TaxID=99658 RepID=A0ABQ8IAS6_9ROSI|nr:hypothetical protein JRO89_XS03G0137100 [Xanthoceras sorbifolium]
MVQFNISAKFLDIQIEYLVQDVENYTLGALWGDMYMMTCSSLPEPSETFKAKVRMPGEYKLLERDMDLQDVFQHFKSKGLDTIMVNIDLLPLVALNPEDMFIFISSSDKEKSDNKVGDEATSKFSQPLSSDDEEYVPRADVDSHQTIGTNPPYEDTDSFHTSAQESIAHDSYSGLDTIMVNINLLPLAALNSEDMFIFVSSSDEEKSDNEVGDEATSNFSQPLSSDDKEYVPRADVDIHQTTGPDPPYEDTDSFHTSI